MLHRGCSCSLYCSQGDGYQCSETFAAGLSEVVKSVADHSALHLVRQQSAQSSPQGLHISGAVQCLPFELNWIVGYLGLNFACFVSCMIEPPVITSLIWNHQYRLLSNIIFYVSCFYLQLKLISYSEYRSYYFTSMVAYTSITWFCLASS